MTKINVVIVTHNRLEYTKRTIDSLFETVPHFNLAIVDNASDEAGFQEYIESDDLFNRMAAREDKLVVFHNKENYGWGTALNMAFSYLGGWPYGEGGGWDVPYMLVSNNDVGYKEGWLEECMTLYSKYPEIGVLGVWKHTSHGVLEDRGDLIVKDQMPAVGWLLTKEHMKIIGPFAEHGPCLTKGGNGEDVSYCITARNKGLIVAGPKEDLGIHFDGY